MKPKTVATLLGSLMLASLATLPLVNADTLGCHEAGERLRSAFNNLQGDPGALDPALADFRAACADAPMQRGTSDLLKTVQGQLPMGKGWFDIPDQRFNCVNDYDMHHAPIYSMVTINGEPMPVVQEDGLALFTLSSTTSWTKKYEAHALLFGEVARNDGFGQVFVTYKDFNAPNPQVDGNCARDGDPTCWAYGVATHTEPGLTIHVESAYNDCKPV